jgi:predicted ABC-type ATPase
MAEPSPTVVVLAGPNGAGKTTASRTLLADTLQLLTFVNADVLAQGLAGFDPDSAAIEAGRIMLERLHTLAEQRADFAFETTLAARSLAPWLKELRGTGYAVHLVYFWLVNADLAVARVAQRVSQGGHHVPEATVRQRYRRSLQNLFGLYLPLVSTWRIYDTTQHGLPQLVAHGDETSGQTVLNKTTWQLIQGEHAP